MCQVISNPFHKINQQSNHSGRLAACLLKSASEYSIQQRPCVCVYKLRAIAFQFSVLFLVDLPKKILTALQIYGFSTRDIFSKFFFCVVSYLYAMLQIIRYAQSLINLLRHNIVILETIGSINLPFHIPKVLPRFSASVVS